MKKTSIIKKVLPIIFLLLLLFLIPLFKTNNSGEYFCNYNLNNIIVEDIYDCEGDFFDKYKIVSGDNDGVITANGGTPTDCVNIISSLLDKLAHFFTVKSQIPDTSVCELAVAQEKIDNLANLIKFKLLSFDSCEISFEEGDVLQAKFKSISNNSHVDANVIADIRYYALRHSVKHDEESKLQTKIDRAESCLNYNRGDVFQNNISSCSVTGDNILDLAHYSTVADYNLNINVDDLLI